MRTYDVYVNQRGRFETIKQGFSWPAFIFNGLWAFTKRLWLWGVILSIISTLLPVAENVATADAGPDTSPEKLGIISALFMMLQLGFWIWVGFQGNRWRAASMSRRGFTLVQGDVEAADRGDAIAVAAPPAGARTED